MNQFSTIPSVSRSTKGTHRYFKPDSLDVPVIRIPSTAASFGGFATWEAASDLPEGIRVRYIGDASQITIESSQNTLCVPASAVASQNGFRTWITSNEAPRTGRYSYIDHQVLIDMSPEEIETHNKLKTEITRVVANLNQERDIGELYSDRVLFTNVAAGLSTEPDASLVLWQTMESGRIKLTRLKNRLGRRYKEIRGTADWVLEILSSWYVKKDTEKNRKAYHRAKVPEFWLVDALGDEIVFQILLWRKRGYVAVTPKDGWHRSRIFGCSFRLDRTPNRMGLWRYRLHVRDS